MMFFKDAQFPQDVILHAVFFYVRFGVTSKTLRLWTRLKRHT